MTDISKILGYGGSATIYGTQVLITSGSFDQSDAPSTLDMLDLPSISEGPVNRSRVKHGDGTTQYTGSVSFDVSTYAINQIVRRDVLMKRNFEYNVAITDGENSWEMEDCLTQNLSLSGAPGGLISASLSFAGTTARIENSVTNAYILNYDSDPQNQPGAYWWSGATDVRDWTFTFNQDVVPMYRNVDAMGPRYLRAGLVTYSLQVTTYSELDYNSISIMTRSFSLFGFTTSKGYTFNGTNDLGMYSHTFETAATNVSDGPIIT